MAIGVVYKGIPAVLIDTAIYTAPVGGANIKLTATNSYNDVCTMSVAIGTVSPPANTDWVRYNTRMASNCGLLEMEAILAAGEIVTIIVDAPNVAVRLSAVDGVNFQA